MISHPASSRSVFARILYVLGVLALINSFFFLAMGIAAARAMSVETLATTGIYEAFMPMFASTVCGAVLTGFGQMLTFIARTAFYAEQCAKLLASQRADASVHEQQGQ